MGGGTGKSQCPKAGEDKGDAMKIFCQYDPQLDSFLHELVEYVLNLYGNQLLLDDLEEIELRESLSCSSDGRVINGGKKIILSSRLFSLLPTYKVSELLENEIYKRIANALYHEMGHVSDMKTMPHIYKVAQNFEEEKQMLSAFFWAEYLAERRSCSSNIIDYTEYCDDFSNRKWKAYKFDFCTETEENFFYLCKALSYFMGRTINHDMRQKFCAKMENALLKSFIASLGNELSVLEDQLPFDDVEKLSNLSQIMNEYRSLFQQTFLP